MKRIEKRILRDVKEFWPAAVAVAGYFIIMNVIFHTVCPMVIVTGLPCPGCGLTRAMLCLASGRIGEAVRMNPMAVPTACLLFYFLWSRYGRGRRAKGMAYLTGAAVLFSIVIYLERMYCLFPDQPPYVYEPHNILAKILPFYEQMLHGIHIL